MSEGPSIPEKANIAVVIVNYRTPGLTMRCVATLKAEKEALPSLRCVVVDGGSGDGSAAELKSALAQDEYHGWVRFLPLELNGGFGWANNQAILELARDKGPPDFIHLLNPDAEVREGAVVALSKELQLHPQCAAVGSKLLDATGAEVASAFRFPSAGRELINAAQSEKLGRLLNVASTVVELPESAEVDWVTGASVMFRAEALKDSRLFDDGFFLYFEEVELMHRLRKNGWSIRHVPESRVAHLEGSSTGINGPNVRFPRYWYESRKRYFALTGGRSSVIAANSAAIAGKAIAALKRLGGRAHVRAALRGVDIFRFGLRPSALDLKPSAPAWGDSPGMLPAWKATAQ